MTTGPQVDGDDRLASALNDARILVGVVHDQGGTADVARILARADIPALCVALAALVPDDEPFSRLLAWADSGVYAAGSRVYTERELQLLHAAYKRGDRTRAVMAGESAYGQRRRQIRAERRSA